MGKHSPQGRGGRVDRRLTATHPNNLFFHQLFIFQTFTTMGKLTAKATATQVKAKEATTSMAKYYKHPEGYQFLKIEPEKKFKGESGDEVTRLDLLGDDAVYGIRVLWSGNFPKNGYVPATADEYETALGEVKEHLGI